MPRWHNPFHRRATLTVSALVLVVGVVAAVAMAAARNPTLQVARHAPVTNLGGQDHRHRGDRHQLPRAGGL